MGRDMLIDGKWHTDVESTTTEDGSYDRYETDFRDWVAGSYRDADTRVSSEETPFEPEAGRYHLYIARNCPWAHGAALVRRLAGLTDAVTMDVVDPVREDEGWEFTPEKEGCSTDRIHGSDYLREVYTAADPEYTGRVSVPVLWDRERETVVNNESIEIMRQFATAFADVGDAGIDLYPEGYRADIDRIVDDIYDSINNGVYRAGFAESQAAYDDAVTDVFAALDHWDSVLGDQRYLAGDRLTLADVRLFPTLVRFDYCYHTAFKCNRQYLHQYENLWPYLRDLYQTGGSERSEESPNGRTGSEATRETPGVAETVVWDHVVDQGYYQGEITPVGPDLDFEAPHDREDLPGDPPEELVRA